MKQKNESSFFLRCDTRENVFLLQSGAYSIKAVYTRLSVLRVKQTIKFDFLLFEEISR